MDISRPLLRWYDAHRRDLPWRRRAHDPYAQLVAEVMLQQTQVATVIPYYQRFLDRFPTVADLACASIDDVLTLWAGLGYYRRARNLHAAAQAVVRDHAGRLPGTVEALMTLPGVGRYTAGAIASIAFGVRAAVLDGNVARVLMRLAGLRADATAARTKAQLWSLAESSLPPRRCGDFNQALMELGATVCSPLAPSCLLCPLRATCRAGLEGTTAHIPPAARKSKVQAAAVVVAAVQRGDKLLFMQRPPTGLWAGLWELPSEPVAAGETVAAARRRLRRRLSSTTRLGRVPLGQVVRQLTHRQMTFHIYAGVEVWRGAHGPTNGKPPKNVDRATLGHRKARCGQGLPARWMAPKDSSSVGISRACEAILRFLDVNLRASSV